MANRKVYNVRNLNQEDYVFDYAAFEADPDAYVFTADDISYLNARELERYEQEVPMTPYEKRMLRKRVISSHSPSENAGSKYLCLTGSKPYDFLDIYRMGRDIRRSMKGMNKSERKAFLRRYMGDTDDCASFPEGKGPGGCSFSV